MIASFKKKKSYMYFSCPGGKMLNTPHPLYILHIVALFRGLIFYRPESRSTWQLIFAVIRWGENLFAFTLPLWPVIWQIGKKHLFRSSQWCLWERGCILFHGMHLQVVWMLSIPPQRTLSWWESLESSHLKWENSSDVLPLFPLFSSIAQLPTVFSTIEVWRAKHYRNITKVKDMSNLNSFICI